jgi:hypothetical protein
MMVLNAELMIWEFTLFFYQRVLADGKQEKRPPSMTGRQLCSKRIAYQTRNFKERRDLNDMESGTKSLDNTDWRPNSCDGVLRRRHQRSNHKW